MLINGYQKDPLARPKHQVTVSTDGGKSYQVIGTTDEPIELLRLEVAAQHAIGMKDVDVSIVDLETREVRESFTNYTPPTKPLNAVPTAEWLAVRDRWLDAIMKFLLPDNLYRNKEHPKYRRRITRWCKANRIELQIHENGATRVMRKGQLLSEFV